MKAAFLDKLINRLDRIDPQSLEIHFLRLAEERGLLETIFQSIQEGVIVVDGLGRLTYANRAAERLLGFTLEAARGRPVPRHLREIDWDGLLGMPRGAEDEEWSRIIAREIELTYPEPRVVAFYAVPLSAERSKDNGAVLILRDVTRDRRQAADQLESERLNAVKLLAAGVAHEIGNPLNALNIHLQLLERELDALPEDPRRSLGELVEVARSEVTRLDLIITQFLRAIRPVKPELAACSIDALLKETLTLLKNEIQNRSIDVSIDVAADIPTVQVDRNQMKQAFFNVIRNAFQAMPDGGSLKVHVGITDRYLSIEFRDTGIGIKPEDFSRIFEPYYTSKPNGSGLGLMIVQRIVQDHGGQIEIASKPSEGTVFTILLPLGEPRMRLLEVPSDDGQTDKADRIS